MKYLILSMLFLTSCEYVGLPNYTIRQHIKVYCLDDDECPDQTELENFFDQEEIIWRESCNVEMENGTDRFGRLKVHFWPVSEYTSSLGRYHPSGNIIDVDYPNPLWKDILRHELGLSVAQAELGYVGEWDKIHWYQCHPGL